MTPGRSTLRLLVLPDLGDRRDFRAVQAQCRRLVLADKARRAAYLRRLLGVHDDLSSGRYVAGPVMEKTNAGQPAETR